MGLSLEDFGQLAGFLRLSAFLGRFRGLEASCLDKQELEFMRRFSAEFFCGFESLIHELVGPANVRAY